MPIQQRSIIERLLEKRVVTESGCWIWTGSKNAQGYGVMQVCGLPRNNRTRLVHRVAISVWRDFDLNSPLKALHHCDNPPCFNPDHLFTGTQTDNMLDCESKGRRRGPTGNKNHTKIDEGIVNKIRSLKAEGKSVHQIKEDLNLSICVRHIYTVINKEAWA